MWSKVGLLLVAFLCIASAKHKELNKNKFSLCDLFTIKKPHAVVTVGPSSTSPAPTTYTWHDTFGVTGTPEPVPFPPAVPPQQVLQYPQQPAELQNQYQEHEYPQQQLGSYPAPQQTQQYPAQQSAQYFPPSQGGQPQTQLQGEQQYQQWSETPTQESQYQSQQENANRQQGIQQPSQGSSQYQQQNINPSQPILEYRQQQGVQEVPPKTQQLGPLQFPPAQYGLHSPPYFQGFPDSYVPPPESVYHHQQQQMEPTERLVVGYVDEQKIFHSLRPYDIHVRRQLPYNSQYFNLAQPNYLPSFVTTP